MSDSKKIRSKLNKLFDDIAQPEGEQPISSEKPKTARKQPAQKSAEGGVQLSRRTPRHTGMLPNLAETASPTVTVSEATSEGTATLSIPFVSGETWNNIEIIDHQSRKWKSEEQALVRDVVDQLTLALQNANLFQQTQRQNSHLEILNEMGRELATQLNVQQVIESAYKFSSQLINTSSFFVALYSGDSETLTFPMVMVRGKRIEYTQRKIESGLTNYVLRTRKAQLLNGDVTAQIEALGIQFISVGNTNPAVSWLGVPITLGSKTLGAIVVQSTETPYLYTEQERDLLTAVASQTAIALQNAQLFEQTQQQNAELAILNDMGNELSSLQTTDGIAAIVYKYAGKLMDVTDFFLAIYHKETEEMSFPLVYFEGKLIQAERQEVGNGLTGYVIRTRQQLYLPENVDEGIVKLELDSLELAEEAPALCWLGVPMVSGQEVLGVVSLQSSKTARLYSERQRDLLSAVANQAAIALQNAQLFEQTQQQNAELAILNDMGNELSSLQTTDGIAAIVYKYAGKLMDVTDFFLAIYHKETEEMSFPLVYFEGKLIQAERQEVGNGLTGYVIRTRQQLYLPENVDEGIVKLELDSLELAEEAPALCWLGVPMVSGQEVLGVVSLQSSKTARLYSERQRDLLSAVANQAAIALQNTRLFQQTEGQNAELSVLNEIIRSVSAEISQEKVFEVAYEKVRTIIRADAFIVALYDEENNVIKYPFNIDEGIRYEAIDSKLDASNYIGQVLLSGAPVLKLRNAENLNKRKTASQPLGNISKISASLLYVPLQQGTKIIGVLSVQSYELNAYSNKEKKLLENIANQLAVAIQNALLYDQVQQRANEQALLNQIVSSVTNSLDLRENLQNVANKITKYFRAGHVGITTLSADKKSLILTADAPAPPGGSPDIGLSISIAGNLATEKVINTRKSLLIEDVPNNPEMEPIREIMKNRGTKHLLILPMLAGDEVIGTIGVDILNDSRIITGEEIALLETIVIQIATAIQNARLYQNIQVSETRFRDVALASADWVWELDPEGRYTYCSDKVFDVLGYKPEDVYGKSPADFMPANEKERVVQILSAALHKKERLIDLETRNITQDGQVVILLTNGLPILDENNTLVGYRGVNKNITEQKLDQAVADGLAEITEAGVTNTSINQVLPAIHKSILKLLPAKNIYFALFDPEKNLISYPYKVDEQDQAPWPSHEPSKNLTNHIIRTGKALRVTHQEIEELADAGIIQRRGAPSKLWIGVPLKTKETIGVVAIQNYDSIELTERHFEIMQRLAPQIATVIDKIRAEESILLQSAALGVAANAIILTDTDGKITWVNPSFSKQTGYEKNEVIGKNTSFLKSGMHDEGYYKQMWDIITSGETWYGEIANRRKDGSQFIVEQTISPVRNSDGDISHYVSIWQDITDRKHTEETLRRQNEYLATATEVGRLITSTLDIPTLFNRTVSLVRSRFGYYHVSIFTVEETGFTSTLREATGEAGEEMKRRQHSLTVGSKSIIGYVTANGKTLIVNNTAIDPIHRPNPLLPETKAEAGIPLKIGSRIIGALDIQAREVGAFMDEDIAVLETLADQIAVAIDNARSYELAQQAVSEMRELDRIKSQFLANMSHELRTPLNSIIGFSRVILKGIDGPVNEQQHQDLSAIYNSGQHLLNLINDVLDLSKIEAGKMELAIEEVNISDTINSVISNAMGLVKDKPVRLEKEIEAGVPTIRADAMRIRQVLINLISNAAKFTEEGIILIKASLHINSSGQQEVIVSVKDTGPGISPENQNKLFQAFSQVDSSPTRKSGGTGLGLSICHRLVQLHEGRIGVHSVVGEGSTFYFTIPAYRQAVREEETNGKIILCIDDDPQIISLYERYLKPQGYKVVALSNPANAKDTIKRIKPYAVTLDIMMPEMDGWQVLTSIKNDAETRDVPIIICSIVEEEEKGFSLGAADYLVKPILQDDLLLSLNRLNGDGTITEVLIIDDSPDDLRLLERIISEKGNYLTLTAEGGLAGWNAIQQKKPHAIILDLFMPDMDGFAIIEKLKTSPELRDIPVIVISGADLTEEQHSKLSNLGKTMLQKGMLEQKELFETLEKALQRLKQK